MSSFKKKIIVPFLCRTIEIGEGKPKNIFHARILFLCVAKFGESHAVGFVRLFYERKTYFKVFFFRFSFKIIIIVFFEIAYMYVWVFFFFITDDNIIIT